MTENDVLSVLLRLARSQKGSSLFINGEIGSGKSSLVARLAETIRTHVYGSIVLGPLRPRNLDAAEFGLLILTELDQQGYLDRLPAMDMIVDLRTAWQWIAENQSQDSHQKWFVLFDLPEIHRAHLEPLSRIFSQARNLESKNPFDASICQVFTGYWDHPDLDEYYDLIKTSFPYTEGNNYLIWSGISQPEIDSLIRGAGKKQNGLEGKILFELCDGHPGAACDIIHQINNPQMTMGGLLLAVHKAAIHGLTAQRLVEDWGRLPVDSKNYLTQLLEQKKISSSLVLQPNLERLRLAGIVREYIAGNRSYLGFRSWFVEQVIIQNQVKIGISSIPIPSDEIIPQAAEICVEAYRIIHHLESLVRNFVTSELWRQHADGGMHPLENRVIQANVSSKRDEDAYERALDWRKKNQELGLASAKLNPLIAYCSTRDLAALINEIGADIASKDWQDIANKINDLADVRDAVMHNQLIDHADLQRLYDLQAEIYAALSVKS